MPDNATYDIAIRFAISPKQTVKNKVIEDYEVIARKIVQAKVDSSENKIRNQASGLSKRFSRILKAQLKASNPEYSASGDLMSTDNIVVMERRRTPAQKQIIRGGKYGAKSDIYSYMYSFRLELPKHRGTEYGYPLGDKNTNFVMPYNVLKQWIRDKGIFFAPSRNGTISTSSNKEWTIGTVAYFMYKKLWRNKIKYYNQDWYKIDFESTNVQGYINQLQNLFISEIKKQ